jgi:hypothetical protein
MSPGDLGTIKSGLRSGASASRGGQDGSCDLDHSRERSSPRCWLRTTALPVRTMSGKEEVQPPVQEW